MPYCNWTGLFGQIIKQLEYLKLDKNTMIIFSSDNGPVLDDGYQDGAVEKNAGHKPAGILRGGKYSAFEGGTRVPWIVSWPGRIMPKVSDAMISQVDLLASFSKLLNVKLPADEARDSEDMLQALLGKSAIGRSVLVEQGGPLSIIKGNWKYIEPAKGSGYDKLTGTETGVLQKGQLYNLLNDPGETNNVFEHDQERAKKLADLLTKIRSR